MSATSENTTFLNAVLKSNCDIRNFLDVVDGLPEKTVLEQNLAEIAKAQQVLIAQLALQIADVNDLLHKHHIKTS